MTATAKAKSTRKPATPKTPEQEIARLKEANKKLRKEIAELRQLYHREKIQLTREKITCAERAESYENLYNQANSRRSWWMERSERLEAKVKELQKQWVPPKFTVLEFKKGDAQ